MKKFSKIRVIILVFLLVLLFYPQNTQAAALTVLSDTMSRLEKSPTNSDHTIKYTTPSGVQAAETMTITFPAGFTIGSVDYTDIDVSWGPSTGSENELTLAETASGTTWGAAFSGQVLTITSDTGTIDTTSKVIIGIGTNASGGDQQITNHATADTYVISIAGSFDDDGKIAIVILDDDQVQLTAAVDPSITFSLSANSSAFGTLSTGSVTTSGTDITLTIGTNAGSGYTVTVRDAGDTSNPGLYNSDASYIIGSTDSSYSDGPTTLVAGTEGYGIYVSGTSGTPTVAARYNGGSGSQVGGLEIADTTIISRITSMSSSDTATIKHMAAIGSFTVAGSYADTLTYIATGNF